MRIVPLLLLVLMGCRPPISAEALSQLNGYWEIERVTFPNGQTKEFGAATTIDYIEVTKMTGFRKKVQPKIDGTFETSNDAERFKITAGANGFELQYTGRTDETWREDLIELSENRFSVTNHDGLTYTYKRYEPLNL